MRRVVLFAMAVVIASACSSESKRSPAQPESISLPLRVTTAQHAGEAHNQSVHLSGDQEVFTPATPGGPTPADSRAQGQAIIQIVRDGDSFSYKLIVSNIENVVQAHIHCAPAGVNGPIVVWFYPSKTATAALTEATGRHDGVLIEDTIEPAHVRTFTANTANNAACPLASPGAPTFAEVLEKIRSGNAYVNVHTNDGVAPVNTGPGDFPGGEVRGQFKDRTE
jgi:CHRD domain